MTKLEELSALLCMEIDEFEKAVGRLEKLNREMKEHPVKVDTSEMELLIREYRTRQTKHWVEQRNSMDRILYSMEKAVVFPSWAVKLGGVLLIVIFLVLGYAMMEVSNIV